MPNSATVLGRSWEAALEVSHGRCGSRSREHGSLASECTVAADSMRDKAYGQASWASDL